MNFVVLLGNNGIPSKFLIFSFMRRIIKGLLLIFLFIYYPIHILIELLYNNSRLIGLEEP